MFHSIKRFIGEISNRIHSKYMSGIDNVINIIDARCKYRMEHPVVMDAILLDSAIEEVGGTVTAFSDRNITEKIAKFLMDYERESMEVQDSVRRANPNLFEVIDVLF